MELYPFFYSFDEKKNYSSEAPKKATILCMLPDLSPGPLGEDLKPTKSNICTIDGKGSHQQSHQFIYYGVSNLEKLINRTRAAVNNNSLLLWEQHQRQELKHRTDLDDTDCNEMQ